jgi:amino-acid N-acetyltransferase
MFRKANINDTKDIYLLINNYAQRNLMLPRSLSELYENIRDFFVYEEKGKILGCCALHVVWEDLAEVKSLAVEEAHKGKGIGKRLLFACLDEAKKLKINKIFVLTYEVDFFKKCGFKELDKHQLPHKIWSECLDCVKFPNCEEQALILNL